jgi:hypothetical protein
MGWANEGDAILAGVDQMMGWIQMQGGANLGRVPANALRAIAEFRAQYQGTTQDTGEKDAETRRRGDAEKENVDPPAKSAGAGPRPTTFRSNPQSPIPNPSSSTALVPASPRLRVPASSSSALAGPLKAAERKELHRLEETIVAGLRLWCVVADALRKVHDEGLYREYGTFETYCRERFGFERAHAYRYLDSAEVLDELEPALKKKKLPLPEHQSQALPLAKIDAGQRVEVWQEVVKRSPKDREGKPRPTAEIAQMVVHEWLTPGDVLAEEKRQAKERAREKNDAETRRRGDAEIVAGSIAARAESHPALPEAPVQTPVPPGPARDGGLTVFPALPPDDLPEGAVVRMAPAMPGAPARTPVSPEPADIPLPSPDVLEQLSFGDALAQLEDAIVLMAERWADPEEHAGPLAAVLRGRAASIDPRPDSDHTFAGDCAAVRTSVREIAARWGQEESRREKLTTMLQALGMEIVWQKGPEAADAVVLDATK